MPSPDEILFEGRWWDILGETNLGYLIEDEGPHGLRVVSASLVQGIRSGRDDQDWRES